MDGEDTFYLRMAGGRVFGPVNMAALRQWASDGRVEPSASVSKDREEWIRATDIPELEMEWVVENAPGQFYGPTHRAVVDDFIKSGTLVATARFYRDMRSGLAERADAEAVAAEANALLAEREEALAAAERCLAEQEKSLSAANAELTGVRDELAKSRELLNQRESALKAQDDALSGCREELSAARAGVTGLQTANRTLAADKQALNDEIARLKGEVERQAGELEEAKKMQVAGRQELEDAKQARQAGQRELEDVKKELAELKRQREAEAEAANVVVPEVVVEGMPPKAPSTFVRPVTPGANGAATRPALGGGVSPFGGASPTSLADLERAAQAELARMRASGAKGFFFGRKK